MNFTIEDLESYLLIVIRLAAFFATAPIFSMMRVPRKFKAGMSVFIAIVVCGIVKVELEPVGGVISFAILILQESIVGILLGFSTFLKNFAPVFIIAFIIYYVLKSFNAVNLKKYTFFKMLTIFIIFISYSLSKTVIFNYIDNLVGQDVARNIIPCYLNVGLRDTGTYSDKNYNIYFLNLKVNNYNFDKTNDIVMKALINDSKYNLSINFFSNKADILFGGDFARISWVLNTLNFNYNSVYVLILNGINLCFFTILVV